LRAISDGRKKVEFTYHVTKPQSCNKCTKNVPSSSVEMTNRHFLVIFFSPDNFYESIFTTKLMKNKNPIKFNTLSTLSERLACQNMG